MSAGGSLSDLLSRLGPQLLQCAVCEEEIRDPVILECLHSMCREHLLSAEQPEGKARCPLCRYAEEGMALWG